MGHGAQHHQGIGLRIEHQAVIGVDWHRRLIGIGALGYRPADRATVGRVETLPLRSTARATAQVEGDDFVAPVIGVTTTEVQDCAARAVAGCQHAAVPCHPDAVVTRVAVVGRGLRIGRVGIRIALRIDRTCSVIGDDRLPGARCHAAYLGGEAGRRRGRFTGGGRDCCS